MSQRPCNRCDFKRLQNHAEERGLEVVIRPSPKTDSRYPDICFPDGVDVFFVASQYGDDGEVWQVWYAELPEKCGCEYDYHDIDA